MEEAGQRDGRGPRVVPRWHYCDDSARTRGTAETAVSFGRRVCVLPPLPGLAG